MDNQIARSASSETGRRPGPPIAPDNDGPYAIAARNSGKSMLALANIFGLKYSTLKMRNTSRYGTEADRKALAKKPYLVPASAWREK